MKLDYLKAQYAKLHASRDDFSTTKQTAQFLIKKGWHYEPWEKRGSIYFQQSVFVTSLVISYARPFTASKGWPGYPGRLMGLSADHRLLHEKLLKLRNGVYAHKDAEYHSYRPVRMNFGRKPVLGTMTRAPSFKLTHQECLDICDLADVLLNVLRPRLEELGNQIADAEEDGA